MKKFILMVNRSHDDDVRRAEMVADYIGRRGGSLVRARFVGGEGTGTDEHYEFDGDVRGAECGIVLGGDGTLLLAARELYDYDIPLFGINTGNLGFLSSAEVSALPGCLDCLLEDEYVLDERSRIRGEAFRDGRLIKSDCALNDIVVYCAGTLRIVEVRVLINGEVTNSYAGDGVIISTPTGSTGYNLSAGGPVVFPDSRDVIITPICPHSLQSRSMVLSSEDDIQIELVRRHKTQNEEAMMTFYGKTSIVLEPSDVVRIGHETRNVKLIRPKGYSFHRILKEKFGSM